MMSMITVNPQTSPSSPSVMLIALTIATVKKNVMIGYQIPICRSPMTGQRLR